MELLDSIILRSIGIFLTWDYHNSKSESRLRIVLKAIVRNALPSYSR